MSSTFNQILIKQSDFFLNVRMLISVIVLSNRKCIDFGNFVLTKDLLQFDKCCTLETGVLDSVVCALGETQICRQLFTYTIQGSTKVNLGISSFFLSNCITPNPLSPNYHLYYHIQVQSLEMFYRSEQK